MLLWPQHTQPRAFRGPCCGLSGHTARAGEGDVASGGWQCPPQSQQGMSTNTRSNPFGNCGSRGGERRRDIET